MTAYQTGAARDATTNRKSLIAVVGTLHVGDDITVYLNDSAQHHLYQQAQSVEEQFSISNRMISGVVQSITRDFLTILTIYGYRKRYLVEYMIRYEDMSTVVMG